MLRIELDGAAIVNTQVSRVSLTPMDSVIAPAEFVTGTPNVAIQVLDLTAAAGAESVALLYNLGAFTIYYALATSAGTTLTTANGIPLPTNSFVTLDTIGGLSVWYITGTAQTAGQGLRVNAGFNL